MPDLVKRCYRKAREIVSSCVKFFRGKLHDVTTKIQLWLNTPQEDQEVYEIYDSTGRRLGICDTIESGVYSKNQNNFVATMSIFRRSMVLNNLLEMYNLA